MNNEIKEKGREIYSKMIKDEHNKLVLLVDYEKMQETITNLQKENDYYFKKNNELSTLNTSLRSDRDDYKQRIDKAIEYLKTHTNNCMFELRIEEMENLLNILKGENK